MTDTPARTNRSGLRFGTKLVLILAGLVAALQVAGWLTVQVAVRNSIDQQLSDNLELGARVWGRLHEGQQRQLLERVAVLADDFGFKEAIATQDAPTLRSLLESANTRIGASHGAILAPDGTVLAARLPSDGALPQAGIADRVAEARIAGFSSGVIALDGEAVSYALVPVFAPDLVGWLALGQSFGATEVEEIGEVTGLVPSVLIGESSEVWSTRFGAWSASAIDAAALATNAATMPLHRNDEALDPAVGLRLSAAETTAVYLVLEADRERAMTPYAQLQNQILGLSLGAALLAMFAAFLIGRRVSGPVGLLARAAERIRQGEYATPLAVRGDDEFAELAGAFNAMQKGIAEREERIVFQSGHDALTALPNRERALILLGERLADDQLPRGALALLDLRRFREVNDLLGHGHGDLALVEVARRLREVVRDGDLVARIGGDEFLLGLWGLDAATAEQRARALVKSLGAAMEINGTPLRLDADLGLVPFQRDESGGLPDARTLLRRAEIALGLAKHEGRTVSLYREGSDEQHLRQLAIVGELRGAIDGHQFELAYQPKVDIAGRQVRHVEALLRWTHPELGRIGPDEFIPLAERAGLVTLLTRWVLERACLDMAAWRSAGFEHGVAINLSAIDLADADLAQVILSAVRRHVVPASAIIVEVTESAVLADLDQAIATLEALRAEGIRVSVDDFGTGQSSLAQLKRLPADELKIDKSFVLQLAPGSDDERIVESIVRLGHALGLKIVAEGVETADGLGVLANLRCDVAQGYFFSRPLAVNALLPWLREHADGITKEARP